MQEKILELLADIKTINQINLTALNAQVSTQLKINFDFDTMYHRTKLIEELLQKFSEEIKKLPLESIYQQLNSKGK